MRIKGVLKWSFLLAVPILLVVIVTKVLYFNKGQSRFFNDQAYNFQTLRALSDIQADGAETAEVLETIRHIDSGNAQSWFDEWDKAGERVLTRAQGIHEPHSRGQAYLRAHNYFRTAEFFLPPDDPKRMQAFNKNTTTFYKGLDLLGVQYERITVPYGDHHLNAVYYPGPDGAEQRPLIVLVGGYDSTLEELYFVLVRAAHDRGYSVLTYEGPGQGAVLREQGLPFTHEWEKPTSQVLDTFLAHHPHPTKMVLVGMSLGGYLAPRAAAFDKRIDGVVAYDVLFDFGEVARNNMPGLIFWLRENGLNGLIDGLEWLKAKVSPGFAWAMANGKWVMGQNSMMETYDVMQRFTLEPVAKQISADVLILAGTEDHFIPLSQVADFQQSLSNARSVTTRVYDRESGGAEHCQLGAHSLWHADFFDWISERF